MLGWEEERLFKGKLISFTNYIKIWNVGPTYSCVCVSGMGGQFGDQIRGFGVLHNYLLLLSYILGWPQMHCFEDDF